MNENPILICVFIFSILIISTFFGIMFLFWNNKMYSISEIVDEYINEDIMPTPIQVREELKKVLRSACKSGEIKCKKVKGKWMIYKKQEAIKYLIKYEWRDNV